MKPSDRGSSGDDSGWRERARSGGGGESSAQEDDE